MTTHTPLRCSLGCLVSSLSRHQPALPRAEMGCASSVHATAAPGAHTHYATSPHTDAKTTEGGGDKPKPAADASANVSRQVVSASALVAGALLPVNSLLALQRSLSPGALCDAVSALVSLYVLWNAHSPSHKSLWAAEQIEYLQSVEADLLAAQTQAAWTSAHYLSRLHAELQAAHTTLQRALDASMLTDAFLQSEMKNHRARLEAIRAAALLSITADAAIDVQHTSAIMLGLLAGNTSDPADPRGSSYRAQGPQGGQRLAGQIFNSALEDPSQHTSASPQVAELFNLLEALSSAVQSIRVYWNSRNARSKSKSTDSIAGSPQQHHHPLAWLVEFEGYLTQIARELMQARTVLEAPSFLRSNGNSANNSGSSPAQDALAKLSLALEDAQEDLASIARSHRTSGGLVSSFLSLVSARSDAALMRRHRLAIEGHKAGLLSLVLTAMQREQSQLLSADYLGKLKQLVSAQSLALSEATALAAARSLQERVFKALAPVDCSLDLAAEHRRFMRGTRASVMQRFATWIGERPAADAGAIAVGESASPLFLLLASPGHGKTVLASHLVESSPARVLGAHFFKFDMASRRGVSRAIRSIVWQVCQNLPEVLPFVVEALEKAGVDVHETQLKFAMAEQAASTEGQDQELAQNESRRAAASSGPATVETSFEPDRDARNDPASSAAAARGSALKAEQIDLLDRLNPWDMWEQLLAGPLGKVDEARKAAREKAEEEQKEDEQQADAAPTVPSGRRFLLFDALDESEGGGSNLFLKLLSLLCSPGGGGGRYALPAWVGVVVSSRPEAHIVRALSKHIKSHPAATVDLDELDHVPSVPRTGSLAQQAGVQRAGSVAPAPSSSAASVSANDNPGAAQQSDLRYFFEAVLKTFMPLPSEIAAAAAASESSSSSSAAAVAAPARSPVLESASSQLSPEAQRAKCLDTLLRKSQGMFLYARLILEQRGLDLSKLSGSGDGEGPVDDPSTPEDESLVQPVQLTPEEIDGFPSGLNNFYLDLLRRAAGPEALASAGSRASPVLSDLMQILSGMVVALEPLSLLQMAQMLSLKGGWEEVVRKSEKIRSVVRIKPTVAAANDVGSSTAAAVGALNPSSVLQLFHRSIRDWLVSAARSEDHDESLFFIDELKASQALLKRAWVELHAEEPTHDEREQALPLLRVADCVLPSSLRETPQFRSSFLAYAVAYLPAHALQVATTASPALFRSATESAPKASVRAAAADVARDSLRILCDCLCNLQYIHIRTCSDLTSLVVATAPKDTLPTSTAAVAMAQEFSAALVLVERLLEQKKKEMAADAAVTTAAASSSSKASPASSLSTSDADFMFLSNAVALLKAFQRFTRSEFSYLQPLEQPRTTPSPLLSCASTLTVLYQQALSYPAPHPVTQQCVRLGEWLREWRVFAQEDTQEILAEIAAAGGQTTRRMRFSSAASTTTPLSSAEASINWRRSNSALARGWVTWLDKPTELSPCVAIVRGVGNVTSLACALTPSLPGLSSATARRTLFAAAQPGGTYEVFDVETCSRLHSGKHGTFVAFDCRPATAVESEAAALAEAGLEDGEPEPPFQLVSCSPYEWSCMDLASSAGGEMYSQNIGWSAATTHLRTMKKQNPLYGGTRDLRYAAAPLRDRALLAQYNSSDSTETLLANRGLIHPFPRSQSGIPEGAKIVAVTFSHDGLHVFVSVERIPNLFVFGCDEHNAGRPPMQPQVIHVNGGSVHATCMALTHDDNAMARGGSDGMVGLWRRTRTQVTKGAWSGEESRWTYEEMSFVSHAVFPAAIVTPVGCVSLTEPSGDRLLAGMMHNVLLFSTTSRQCLAVFHAKSDPLGGVAITPDGQYALCGGGGVDGCVRIWELPSAAEEIDLTARVIASETSQAQSTAGPIPAAPVATRMKRSVRTLFFHREVDSPDQSLFWNDNGGIHHLRQRREADGSCCSAAADKGSIPVRNQSLCRVAAISPADSNLIVCGSNYKDLELWSLTTRPEDKNDAAAKAVVNPEMDPAAWMGRESRQLVRRFTLSTEFLHRAKLHPAVVQMNRVTGESMSFGDLMSIRFTPCGRFLIAAGNLWDILVWEVSTGELVHILRLNMEQQNNSMYVCYEIHTLPIARDAAAIADGYSELYLAAVCPQDVVCLWRIKVWEAGRGPLMDAAMGAASSASSVSPSPAVAVPKRQSIEVRLEWERQLDQLSAFGCTRGLLLYQPLLPLGSAPDAIAPDALILLGDAFSVVHIRRLRNGEELFAFSTAPSMVHVAESEENGVMQLMLVDRQGVHGAGTEEKIDEDAAASASERSGDVVQLVTLNAYTGLCFWALGPLLRSLSQADGAVVAETRTLAPVVDFPGASVPTLRSKGEGFPTPFPLYPPPQLRAQFQCCSTQLSRFAMDRRAERVALANIDGAVFVFQWKEKPSTAPGGSASTSSSDSLGRRGVVDWHGLFEFHPAQRSELCGLISQLQCEAEL